MLPLPKILTLPGLLLAVVPKASPGKPTDWAEKSVTSLFYGVVGWSMLGAPNWLQSQVSLPKIETPKVEQVSNFTTAQTSTTLKTPTATGVLVRCPSSLQVVNIRQGAGLTAVRGQVACGDRVNVMGTDRSSINGETWVPVEHKGIKGWATARYLAL